MTDPRNTAARLQVMIDAAQHPQDMQTIGRILLEAVRLPVPLSADEYSEVLMRWEQEFAEMDCDGADEMFLVLQGELQRRHIELAIDEMGAA